MNKKYSVMTIALILLLGFISTIPSAQSDIRAVTSLNTLTGDLTLVSNDTSITITNGIFHITEILNMAHANTWTGQQTFNNGLGTAINSGLIFPNPSSFFDCNFISNFICHWSPNGITQILSINSGIILLEAATQDFVNGQGGTLIFQLTSTGLGQTQGYQSIIAQPLSNGATVTTINLPVTEPDTTYAVVCTPNGSTALGAWWIDTKATGSFHFHTTNNAGASSTVDCIITHQ